MNSLKLYKSALTRVLFPLTLAFAVLLVLFALDILRVWDMSDYFELVTIAATLAAAFFTVKEIFSLSVCCGVSRKTSFAAILICAFVTAFIVVAAHSIESFIFADKLKGTVIRLDGVAVDYTHAEILQNYSLLSLSFSKSAAYIYSMLFVRTFLIFFSGSAFFIIMSRLERTGKLINCGLIVILAALNIGGGIFIKALRSPLLSYEFFENIVPDVAPIAFSVTYAALTIIAALTAYLFWHRKPIKRQRGVK